MKRVTEHIRDHLFKPAARLPDIATIKRSQCSQEFYELMTNRMVMGAFRYGTVGNWGDVKYDHIGSLKKKLALYEQDGNTEHLADLANYAMLEYRFGKHPKRHFSATDDKHHAITKG